MQVKKFAAKIARQQGRTEDRKELQSLCKAFLKSDKYGWPLATLKLLLLMTSVSHPKGLA